MDNSVSHQAAKYSSNNRATQTTRPPPQADRSHESLGAIHSPASDDGSVNAVSDPLRLDELFPTPGQRPAGGRLSGDPGNGWLSRREPRHDRQQHRHATRAPVRSEERRVGTEGGAR